MPNVLNIGEQIRKYRNGLHITQKELADKLYVTQQAVQRWEKGSSFPQIDKVVEIADIFDISVSDLYFDDSDVAYRYININITDHISFFVDRVVSYLENHSDIFCRLLLDVIDKERDESGQLCHSVGFDRVEYDAYSMLKHHSRVNDVNFWRCVDESDCNNYISGKYYFDKMFDLYPDNFDANDYRHYSRIFFTQS